jgi:hypothetical protein
MWEREIEKEENNPCFYFEARFPIERPKTVISAPQLNRNSCVDILRPTFNSFWALKFFQQPEEKSVQ